MTNEVEEETNLRREIDEHVAELREDYEQTNGQKMAAYEAELAEWKNYEKARVSPCMYNIIIWKHLYSNTCGWGELSLVVLADKPTYIPLD